MDTIEILRAVADRTTTGDTLDRTARAFLGLPPRDDRDRDRKTHPAAADWGMVNTFDLLASEYGWSRDAILDLSLTQIRRIADAIAARYRRQNPDGDDGSRRGEGSGKVEPIDRADPTWQFGTTDPRGGPWDSVPPHVAEKFRRAGYVSMMDHHEKGRAKVEKLEAEERARKRAGIK